MTEELKKCPIFDRIKKTNSGCWLWSGCKNNKGYGELSYHGKLTLAHRVAWIEKYGEIPKGKLVCHSCDIPNCVNPEHLFIGTYSDNMQDCKTKGRLDTKGNAHKKLCKNGHQFTKENTRYNKYGHRTCRTCDREWHRRNYEPR